MPFSNSQLETYENCPFKYRLQYIDRIKTARKSIEAFTGSLVHESLEKLYRDLRMSCCLEARDLENHFMAAWTASCNEDIFVVRSEYSPDDYREMGRACIRNYYQRYYPFDNGVPIWLEQRVRICIPDGAGGSVDFVGILDRLDSLEGSSYEIHDYKTSMSLPSQEQIEGDRQLSLYQLAVEQAFPDAHQIELVWHYLVFDRERRVQRESHELEEIALNAARLARQIETSEDFPARESALCEWCELQEHCPKRKHLFAVAWLPARELGTERGIQLVDEYGEWMARKHEADHHLRELREEISEFSAYYGADNLRGSSSILKISRQRLPKVPPKGSAAREELERVLRQVGAWDQVSVLNAQKLGSALVRGGFEKEVAARVESFIEWDESRFLRLRPS